MSGVVRPEPRVAQGPDTGVARADSLVGLTGTGYGKRLSAARPGTTNRLPATKSGQNMRFRSSRMLNATVIGNSTRVAAPG